MGRWQANLAYKQAFLGRVVDIGAELFAMAACCSRAEMILHTAPENAASAYELAEAFCEQARVRTSELEGRPTVTIVGVPDDDHVTVRLDDGTERRLALDRMREATLAIDWSRLGRRTT